MPDHPDNLPRDLYSYDPDEPLIVRYADVIAARNAVANLANIVRDKQTSLSDYSQGALKRSLTAAVDQGSTREQFTSLDEAAQWLVDLRDRLKSCLPFPTSLPPTPPGAGPGPER